MRIIESGKTKQMADLNMVPLELQEALGAVIPEGQGNAAKHDCKREKQLEDRGMAVCPARPNRHFPDCNWGMG